MAIEKTIELDCAPGWPRPGDLIDGVIEGTGLPQKKPCSMFFGNWVWDYQQDVTDEQWLEIQKITKPRIEQLYHNGQIRYGSW